MGVAGKHDYWHTKDGLILLECWTRDGLTDEQIAKNIGIQRPTLYDWKKKYSDISDALKKGKEIVDYEVENALLKRALGYEYDEEKIEVQKDRNGKTISTKVVQTVKQIPPDVGAIALWLKNRRPDKWRDKQPDEEKADDKAVIIDDIK